MQQPWPIESHAHVIFICKNILHQFSVVLNRRSCVCWLQGSLRSPFFSGQSEYFSTHYLNVEQLDVAIPLRSRLNAQLRQCFNDVAPGIQQKKKIAVCEMVDATEVSEEHALES